MKGIIKTLLLLIMTVVIGGCELTDDSDGSSHSLPPAPEEDDKDDTATPPPAPTVTNDTRRSSEACERALTYCGIWEGSSFQAVGTNAYYLGASMNMDLSADSFFILGLRFTGAINPTNGPAIASGFLDGDDNCASGFWVGPTTIVHQGNAWEGEYPDVYPVFTVVFLSTNEAILSTEHPDVGVLEVPLLKTSSSVSI